ncbi:hypothetical protein J7M02_04725, partial [Candidatus Aerophobetes bacterium]|nr:hypothetical protein [Candidatus Aerophobetes bacterium]
IKMSSWTPPDPFITELNWDEYSSEAQANMVNVNGKGVIICWDKYFLELRDAINSRESDLGFPVTSWTPFPYDPSKPYIWDQYIKEMRNAVENLVPYTYPGQTYQSLLEKYFGYTQWCDGQPLSNNYIWDRCIEEIRKLLPKVYIINYQRMWSLRRRGWWVGYPEEDIYDQVKNDYTNAPVYDKIDIQQQFWPWMRVRWRSFVEKYETSWSWSIYAMRLYLIYDTQFLSNQTVTKAWFHLFTRSKVSDWEPHVINLYRVEWNVSDFPSWDEYKDGILIFEEDIDNFQEDGYNSFELDPSIINTQGVTQFTLLNAATKDPHINNTWPPNPFYQNYEQNILCCGNNLFYTPYLTVYCYD